MAVCPTLRRNFLENVPTDRVIAPKVFLRLKSKMMKGSYRVKTMER